MPAVPTARDWPISSGRRLELEARQIPDLVLAILIYLAVADRRGALTFIGGALGILGVAFLILRVQTGPWATWYLWDLPRMHAMKEDLIGRFWFMDFLNRFTLPLVLGPVFLVEQAIDRRWRTVLFYALAAGSLLGLSWVSRSTSGGGPNVLLPGHLAAARLLGLGLAEAVRRLDVLEWPMSAFRAYVFGLCVLQFALIAYNPRLMVPYAQTSRPMRGWARGSGACRALCSRPTAMRTCAAATRGSSRTSVRSTR